MDKILTKEDYDKLGRPQYYDDDRWNTFFKVTVDELKTISGLYDINSVLEIGPHWAPYVHNSDIMDLVDYREYFPFEVNDIIIHDGSKVPYPIEDKKYDLVILSHSLEHFGENQREAFKELVRITDKALITLPYKWFQPSDIHHAIDDDVIHFWTLGIEPVKRLVTLGGLDGLFQQILLFYDFSDINYEDIDDYVLLAGEYRFRYPPKEYISIEEHNAIVNEYQNKINQLSSANWLK